MARPDLTAIVTDEGASYDRIQVMRDSFSPELFKDVRANSRDEALARAGNIVHSVLSAYDSMGINLKEIDPGHGAQTGCGTHQ